MLVLSPETVGEFIPSRRKDGHKGDFGRVLVVAGSREMTGAAVLTTRAALKAGAGLVSMALPASLQVCTAGHVIEATSYGLSETLEGAIAPQAAGELLKIIERHKFDLLLIGPGLGASAGAVEFVQKFLKECPLPAIVDADALNAIASTDKPDSFFGKGGPVRILTPHVREAERILKTDNETIEIFKEQSSLRLAAMANGVGVLKGHETVIGCVDNGDSPRCSAVNNNGSCELAKAGSGDVLAGLMAGFWAQAGKSRGFTAETAFESACAAVYLHGECGILARRELTEYCVLASELLERLPRAIKKTLIGEQ